jgi:hypothetical protein
MRAHTHTHIHTHVCTHTHVHTLSYSHASIHTSTHTSIHSHTKAHTHTHTPSQDALKRDQAWLRGRLPSFPVCLEVPLSCLVLSCLVLSASRCPCLVRTLLFYAHHSPLDVSPRRLPPSGCLICYPRLATILCHPPLSSNTPSLPSTS